MVASVIHVDLDKMVCVNEGTTGNSNKNFKNGREPSGR